MSLDGPDGMAHYWHKPDADHQFLSRRHFPVGSVMCWGEIDLVWINGSSNAENYQKLLKKYLISFMDGNYIFQQIGTLAHTAESTMKSMRRNKIRLLL